MPHRNTDGTFRNNNKATRVSQRSLLANWVRAEALSLKLLGFTFSRIATQLTEVGRGMQRSITPLPSILSFPPNYSITPVACFKAVKLALRWEPSLRADELRQLLLQRGEQLFMACQSAVQRGETKAILTAIRALELQASINGLKSTKISDLLVPVEEKRDDYQLPAQAVVSGFDAAVRVLYECGAVPRPAASDPKLIEVTPTESKSKDDR